MTVRPISAPTDRSNPAAEDDDLLPQAHEDERAREQEHRLDVEGGEEVVVLDRHERAEQDDERREDEARRVVAAEEPPEAGGSSVGCDPCRAIGVGGHGSPCDRRLGNVDPLELADDAAAREDEDTVAQAR